jgi:hypothetical protein
MVEALLRLRGLDPRTGVSSWHRHPGESLPVYAFTYNQHFDVLREDAADPGPVVAAVVSRYGDRGAVGECVREDSAAFVEWGILLDEDMMGRFLAREIPAFDDAPGATLAEFLVALREPAFRADTEVAQWRAEASAAAAYLVPESPTAVRVALLVDGEGNLLEDRAAYVLSLLADWSPRGSLEPTGRPVDAVLKPARGEGPPPWPELTVASTGELAESLAGYVPGRRHVRPLEIGLDRLTELLGEPHHRREDRHGALWSYRFAGGGDLFVIEGSEERSALVLCVPKEGPNPAAFARFCEMIGA